MIKYLCNSGKHQFWPYKCQYKKISQTGRGWTNFRNLPSQISVHCPISFSLRDHLLISIALSRDLSALIPAGLITVASRPFLQFIPLGSDGIFSRPLKSSDPTRECGYGGLVVLTSYSGWDIPRPPFHLKHMRALTLSHAVRLLEFYENSIHVISNEVYLWESNHFWKNWLWDSEILENGPDSSISNNFRLKWKLPLSFVLDDIFRAIHSTVHLWDNRSYLQGEMLLHNVLF